MGKVRGHYIIVPGLKFQFNFRRFMSLPDEKGIQEGGEARLGTASPKRERERTLLLGKYLANSMVEKI